jgi:hypothetical protein
MTSTKLPAWRRACQISSKITIQRKLDSAAALTVERAAQRVMDVP